MKTLYLVDASSLFFRAFYAIPPLTNSKGFPTNAIYGFLNQLIRLLREKNPELIALCLDRKEPSFRKEIYPDYKANRTELPEALAPQLPFIEAVGDLLGIRSFSLLGFEADDLIGTLTKFAETQDYKVVIVSGDKDFAQLVDDKVCIYDTMKEFTYGPKEVLEKWGVHPHQFIDYLSLTGDSSDHIPGVAGIGPKGAAKLIHEFGDLDQIYQKIDQVKGATQNKLLQSKDNAYLSKRLVEIATKAPIEFHPEELKLKKASSEKLKSFFEEFNFKSFDRDSRGLPNLDTSPPLTAPPAIFHWPDNKPDNQPGTQSGNSSGTIVEASSRAAHLPAEHTTKIHDSFRISELPQEAKNYWISLEPELILIDEAGANLYKIADDLSVVRDWIRKSPRAWQGYDLKTLWHKLWPHPDTQKEQAQLGFQTSEEGEQKKLSAPPLKVDTDLLLLAYMIHAGENLELEALIGKYLPQFLNSSEMDRVLCLPLLKSKMLEALELEPESTKLKSLYEEVEEPLATILFEMETFGFRLDREELRRQSEELALVLDAAEKKIHQLAGEVFNVGSPKQLAQILFTKLKLPPGHKTKTGFSTDNEVLEGLKTEHPIAGEVLEYREVAKLKSTYLDAFPQMLDRNERLHTTFRQAFTTTGRLSSIDPNLQNIPIRTERGARIRRAFIAGPGRALLSADYSQIELRILAHISGDDGLIKAFREDLDIHAATAAEIFKVDLSAVTPEHRRIAKSVNFGIAYGQGAFGLAENLGISRTEAQGIIKSYFEKFPGVKSYIDQTILESREKGYVSTLFGRARKIPEIKSQSPMVKKAGERAAINAPIQGTAADIVKIAMVRLKNQVSCPMISQVHDELIFEDSVEELKVHASKIVRIMETAADLKVPLKVNWAIGQNWDQAH